MPSQLVANDKSQRLLVVFSLPILGGVWAILSYTDQISSVFLPSPTALIAEFFKRIVSLTFLLDVLMSTVRVAVAFGLSFLFALPAALAMYKSRHVEAVFAPYVDFARYLPVPALVPLTILWLGVDEVAKVTILFLGTAFQLTVLLMDELKAIPTEYRELVYSLRKRGLKWTYWMLRQVLPSLYDHCRIAVGWCWTYVIIAELIAADRGLGHFIKEAQRFNNVPALYVGIISMGLLGLATDTAFKAAYPRIFPYMEQRQGRA